MSAPTRLMTYDDLLAMPGDGQRYELLDGALVVPAASSFYHARIVLDLIRTFEAYLAPRGLRKRLFTAPVDVRLTDLRVVQPDILYVSPDRSEAFSRPPAIQGAPDLVVEVMSSSNRSHDLVVKFGYYEEAGVREYWMVDPDNETIAIYVLTAGRFVEQPTEGGIARSVALPGLEVDVTTLFTDLV